MTEDSEQSEVEHEEADVDVVRVDEDEERAEGEVPQEVELPAGEDARTDRPTALPSTPTIILLSPACHSRAHARALHIMRHCHILAFYLSL